MFIILQGVFARTQIPQKVHFLRNLVFAKKHTSILSMTKDYQNFLYRTQVKTCIFFNFIPDMI